MSNFLRALRFTWPYRGRLFLSWGCAVLIGVLWAANISAIYPIVKLLFDDGVSLHQWIDNKVADSERAIREHQLQLAEVETDGVEPMTRMGDMTLPMRADAVTAGNCADAVLANAPEAEDGYFAVPKVVE